MKQRPCRLYLGQCRVRVEGCNPRPLLDAGDIQMFGMTIFVDKDAPEDDVRHIKNQIQGIKNWIEYALSKNPETIFFFIGQPWLGRPLEYIGDTGDPKPAGMKNIEAGF